MSSAFEPSKPDEPRVWPDDADAVLSAAARAVSAAHGEHVLDELTRYLCEILDVELAFVARHDPGSTHDMHVLSQYCDGQVLQGGDYVLATSPCVLVVGQDFRAFPKNVRELFPDDEDLHALELESYAGFPLTGLGGHALGVVAVLSRKPLERLDRIEPLLRIFAVRAAAEIEQSRAREALERSVASYRAIFEAAEEAILIHDWETGAFLDANPKACATFGWSRDELLQLSADELSSGEPPYTAEQLRHYMQLAREDRCPPFEWHRRNRDGSLHWDEVRLKPVFIEGRPHILAFTRDITERKASEEALRASEEQYRAIFNASTDGFVLRDADFRIVEVNSTFERWSGHTRSEVIGSDRVIANPDDALSAIRRLHRTALAGKAGIIETELLHRNGETRKLELRAAPVHYRGRPHVLYAGRDITERMRAEAARAALENQLRQAQKMEAIGQLTGGIAHDFNNILTSVIGYGAMARERATDLGDVDLVRQLDQAHLAAGRARELIAQMLAFARKRRSERRVILPEPVVRQTLNLLRATLPASIELELVEVDANSEATTGPVNADAVQIEQLLFNLCLNARDAIGGKGAIRVALRNASAADCICASCRARLPQALWVEISVADTGNGIAPEVMERMFDPFFTTKEVGRGSGMGLAMVHGIVHEHGGHVVVETQPGAGSTFRILLPAVRSVATQSPQPLASPSTLAPLTGRVLLVEDETMVGDFMTDRLHAWGLDVVLHRNPLEALDWLADASNPVDVLLTDQTMPHLTGLELVRHCRKLRPTLPVLLYSGYAESINATDLQALGTCELLLKPVDARVLHAALVRFLG